MGCLGRRISGAGLQKKTFSEKQHKQEEQGGRRKGCFLYTGYRQEGCLRRHREQIQGKIPLRRTVSKWEVRKVSTAIKDKLRIGQRYLQSLRVKGTKICTPLLQNYQVHDNTEFTPVNKSKMNGLIEKWAKNTNRQHTKEMQKAYKESETKEILFKSLLVRNLLKVWLFWLWLLRNLWACYVQYEQALALSEEHFILPGKLRHTFS